MFDKEIHTDNLILRRVTKEDAGFSILIPYGRVSKPKDATDLIIDLRASYGCKEIKNIEIDYFETYWLLFGFPKVKDSPSTG